MKKIAFLPFLMLIPCFYLGAIPKAVLEEKKQKSAMELLQKRRTRSCQMPITTPIGHARKLISAKRYLHKSAAKQTEKTAVKKLYPVFRYPIQFQIKENLSPHKIPAKTARQLPKEKHQYAIESLAQQIQEIESFADQCRKQRARLRRN